MTEDLYVVPTGNRKQLTVSCESADDRPNERSLPVDLVRDGRIRPVAGSIASRNPGPSISAQYAKAQIAEARGRRHDGLLVDTVILLAQRAIRR
jgi:hypothetical protein